MSINIGTRRALLGGKKLRPFLFDLARSTFTPSMAVRAGALMGGAPMFQGKYDGSGTPDVVSYLRGDQISGNWYVNFDINRK